MASTRQKRLQDALRREISRGVQTAAKQKPPERQGVLSLAAGLRNVKRTTTNALDAAGVPEHLQGGDEADWDANDHEEWGY